MRFSLRTVLIALVALVAIGGLFSTGAISTVSNGPAVSSSVMDSTCQTPGVSLVIEYGADREPQTACAENFAGTGWELFATTGQKVEGTTEYPVGFVCKINEYPAEQSCSGTPSSDQGSWAYYFATFESGETWRFSPVGASTRKPQCGDFEGWVYLSPGEKAHPPLLAPRPMKCN